MKRTVTTFLLAALMVAFAAQAMAQVQAAGTKLRWFRTNTVCPGVYDHSWEGVAESPVVFQDLQRSGPACEPQASALVKTSAWSTSPAIDPSKSMVFAMTPEPGIPIDFDGSNDKVRLKLAKRNADGPNRCQFFYAIEDTPLSAIGTFFTVTTTSTSYDLTVPVESVAPGQLMKFHLFCWNAASASGTLVFEQVLLLFDEVLPVELVAFDAVADGADVALRWETAAELNNAGFFVEMNRTDAETFEQLGFVEGNGTTEMPQHYQYRVEALDPGVYTFRLKQVDYDGTFEYHPEIEVVVGMAERFVMDPVFPNPFNPQARFRFAVNRAQHVEVALFDMLGRQVRALYTGRASAGQMQVVNIDGSDLPSGLYLVRVIGETFVQTQKVTLVK